MDKIKSDDLIVIIDLSLQFSHNKCSKQNQNCRWTDDTKHMIILILICKNS